MKGQLSIREEGLMLSFVIHSEKARTHTERERVRGRGFDEGFDDRGLVLKDLRW